MCQLVTIGLFHWGYVVMLMRVFLSWHGFSTFFFSRWEDFKKYELNDENFPPLVYRDWGGIVMGVKIPQEVPASLVDLALTTLNDFILAVPCDEFFANIFSHGEALLLQAELIHFSHCCSAVSDYCNAEGFDQRWRKKKNERESAKGVPGLRYWQKLMQGSRHIVPLLNWKLGFISY